MTAYTEIGPRAQNPEVQTHSVERQNSMKVMAVADKTWNASRVTSKGQPRPTCKHKSIDACLCPKTRRPQSLAKKIL